MQPYTARWLAWSAGIVSIVLLLAALALYYLDRNAIVLPESVGVWSLLTVDIAVNLGVPILGILIATRRPDNAIGWLYIAAGLFLGIAAFGQLYAVHALLAEPGQWPGGRLAAWIGTAVSPIPLCTLPFLFLLFPTGHLASRRWRPVWWLSGAVLLGLTIISAMVATRVWADPFVGSEEAVSGLPPIVIMAVAGVVLAFPIAMFLSFASVVTRFRGSTDEERLQLKWFVTAAAVVAVTFSVGFFIDAVATSVASSLGLLFLDASIAIAILKHRLYDIDVIIGKTIVQGRSRPSSPRCTC